MNFVGFTLSTALVLRSNACIICIYIYIFFMLIELVFILWISSKVLKDDGYTEDLYQRG